LKTEPGFRTLKVETMATHQVHAEAHNGFRRMSGEDEMMFNNPSPFEADVSLLGRWVIGEFFSVPRWRIFRIHTVSFIASRHLSWRVYATFGGSCDVVVLLQWLLAAGGGGGGAGATAINTCLAFCLLAWLPF
jgi:hypothetical protein